jgi:hypothetical protein
MPGATGVARVEREESSAMSDPNPPELEPIPPLGVPGPEAPSAEGADSGDGEPPHKPVWKSWAAAGVVAAAFVGGGILAVTLAGHGKDSPAVQTASASPQTQTYGGPNGNGPNGGGRFDGRFGGRGAQGKITAVKGSTLTLDSTDFSGATTTMTVTTTADTKVTETVAGSVSDIAVGDNVFVVGESTGSAVTATNIVDNGERTTVFRNRANGQGGPGFAGPGGRGSFTAGAVTSVDGSTITIKTVAGDTVTVSTTADTKVTVTKTIKLSDLAVGDTVRVNGTTTGTTIAADAIEKGELGFGLGGGLRRPDGMNPPGTGSQRDRVPGDGSVPGSATS